MSPSAPGIRVRSTASAARAVSCTTARAATVKYGAGDTVDLKLIGTADGFTLIYGDNETASTGFDYALTAIDSDYIYVGFYVARNANVTFSDIQLTTNGVFSASGSGLKAVWNKVKDLFPF